MFRTLLISMFLTSTAFATTWTVDDDGKADFDNIQAAVDAASDGDEIIVMPGFYSGTGDEVINTLGKILSFTALGGSDVTFISGQAQRRCVQVESPGNVSLDGFFFLSGFAEGNGAGIQHEGSRLDLIDCKIWSCTSQARAGAIEAIGNLYMWRCDVQNNIAVDVGAIECYSTGFFEDCTFIGNSTIGHDSWGGEAGAIKGACHGFDCNFNLTIEGCYFEDNVSATHGGGAVFIGTGGSLSISYSTFIGNSAKYGGAVHISCGSVGAGDNVYIGGCVFTNNQSRTGGALSLVGGEVVSECTFIDNYSIENGGGIYSCNWHGQFHLSSSTFCGNTRSNGEQNHVFGNFHDEGGISRCDACTADINLDGNIGVNDVLGVVSSWGTCDSKVAGCLADINFDGIVDVSDLLIVVGNWGPCE